MFGIYWKCKYGYKRLFIWVEGEEDKRFFEKIIEPKLKKKYNLIETIRYSMLRKEKIDNFLKSIQAMDAEYIFVIDINNSPCITLKKQEAQNKYRNIDTDRIIVVIKESESWYLAGLDKKSSRKFGISDYIVTDNIIKEKFNSLYSKKFNSRIDFILEILKIFSVDIAKKKNKSFRYCIDKFI